MDIVENTATRLVMKDNGKTNASVAWGLTIVGVVGTIASVVTIVLSHHAAMSPAVYALSAISLILLLAGLYSLNTVYVTTCTLNKEINRFIWNHKQIFQGSEEKRFPISSIKSIEVTQKRVSVSKSNQKGKSYWWFILMKSGSRFEEPGAGSTTPYEADRKAILIRDFLGGSLMPTAQDPLGNERGIGDETVFNVLAQLTDLEQRNKES